MNGYFKGIYDDTKRAYLTSTTNPPNIPDVDYKSLHNYIHNDLGISKTDIQCLILKEMEQIIKDEVSKALHDEQRIQYLIEQEILRQIKYDKDYKRHSFLISVMDSIYNKIDGVIHEEVLKRLQITLKEPTEEDEQSKV